MCSSISWILWSFHQSKCSLNGYDKTMVVQISWYGVSSMAFMSGAFSPVIQSVVCCVVHVELVVTYCLVILLSASCYVFPIFSFLLEMDSGFIGFSKQEELILGMNFLFPLLETRLCLTRKMQFQNIEN